MSTRLSSAVRRLARVSATSPGRWFGFARASVLITAGLTVLLGGLWATTLQRIDFERAQELANSRRHTANLALAFEEHIRSTLKSADQLLRSLAHQRSVHGQAFDLKHIESLGVIDHRLFSYVGMADRRGVLLSGSDTRARVDVSDRDYFRRLRDGAAAPLFVGAPLTGRVSGRVEIPVARVIALADHSFGGVAMVGLDPTHLSRFYSQVDLGRSALIQVVGLDGIVRARWDARGHSWGQSMQGSTLLEAALTADEGTFASLGRLDGIRRYMSFRVLRDYGLTVAVGMAVEETLEGFEARRRNYLRLGALATLLLVGLGAALIVATERKERAIGATLASESRYRSAFEQSAFGIAHVDLEGKFIQVNAAFRELLGYTEGELLGRRFSEFTHPEDAVRSEELRRSVAENRSSAPIEKRYLRKGGAAIWVVVAAALVRDPHGRPAHFVTMVQDISSRKAAEERLHEQLDELRRFQKVTVERELRMIDLEQQLAGLRRIA